MSNKRAPIQIYRKSDLGAALLESLEELQSERNLPEDLSDKVMDQFDKSISDALSNRTRTKVTGSGQLHTYRYCDNVWIFIVENASFRTDTENISCDKVKIVAVDGSRSS